MGRAVRPCQGGRQGDGRARHVLLSFYDFPEPRFEHLRTTNRISSRASWRPSSGHRSPRALTTAKPRSRWPTSCSPPPGTGGGGSVHRSWCLGPSRSHFHRRTATREEHQARRRHRRGARRLNTTNQRVHCI
jgi:hypothetical protein